MTKAKGTSTRVRSRAEAGRTEMDSWTDITALDEESVAYFYDSPPDLGIGEPRFTEDRPDPFFEPDYAYVEDERRRIVSSYGMRVGCVLVCYQLITLLLASASFALSYQAIIHDRRWNKFFEATKIKLTDFFGDESPNLTTINATVLLHNLTQFLKTSDHIPIHLHRNSSLVNLVRHRKSHNYDIFTRDSLEEKVFMYAMVGLIFTTFIALILEAVYFTDRNFIKTMVNSTFNFLCAALTFALSILMVVSISKLNGNVLDLSIHSNSTYCNVLQSVFCLCHPRIHGLLDDHANDTLKWIHDHHVCQLGDHKMIAAVLAWMNSIVHTVTACSCLHYFYSTAELNELKIEPLHSPSDTDMDMVLELRAVTRRKYLQQLVAKSEQALLHNTEEKDTSSEPSRKTLLSVLQIKQ